MSSGDSVAYTGTPSTCPGGRDRRETTGGTGLSCRNSCPDVRSERTGGVSVDPLRSRNGTSYFRYRSHSAGVRVGSREDEMRDPTVPPKTDTWRTRGVETNTRGETRLLMKTCDTGRWFSEGKGRGQIYRWGGGVKRKKEKKLCRRTR